MPNDKEIKPNREPGLCVIRDDDQDWGGPGHDEIPTEKKSKTKKETVQDEPMNWPFNRYRL